MGGLGNIIATTMPSVSYRNAVNAEAVIMRILMADPQGCATLGLSRRNAMETELFDSFRPYQG